MSGYNTQTKEDRREELADMPKDMQLEILPLFKVQSTPASEHHMVAYIIEWLGSRGLNYEIDLLGNILVTKGYCDGVDTFYQCICAHMDTVHAYNDDFKLSVRRKQNHQLLYAFNKDKQVGVGGDDKCGVYSVFKALEKFDNIKAVFFTQEESGLIGSGGIDLNWFNDVGSVIQLDRWGRSDFICRSYYTPTVSKTFLERARDSMMYYDYKEAEGLITDSINLFERGVGLSCINVSCGYYQHHTSHEFVDVNQFYNSVLFVLELIEALGHDRYTHYDDAGLSYGYGRYNNSNYDFYNDDDAYSERWNNGKKFDERITSKVDYEASLLALDELGFSSIYNIQDKGDVQMYYWTYKSLADADDTLSEEEMAEYVKSFYT